MEKKFENRAEISVDNLAEEELQDLEKRIRETRLARKREAAEKALAERKEKEAKLSSEKKARAQAVEEAFKKAADAAEEANKLLNEFIKDYHYFHWTTSSTVTRPQSLWDVFVQNFFNF